MKIKSISWLTFTVLYGCSSVVPQLTRGPASAYRAEPVTIKAKINRPIVLSAKSNTVNVCGVSFEEVSLKSSDPRIFLNKRSETLKGSALHYQIPDGVSFASTVSPNEGPDLLKNLSYSYQTRHPILPNIPITEKGLDEKLCAQIRQYHQLALQTQKKIFSFDAQSSGRSLMRFQGKGSFAESERRDTRQTTKFVIIYDDLYEQEAQDLAQLKSGLGIPTMAIAVSELPGMNRADPIPDDCEGDFLKECYHFWGDSLTGVSQLAVPSLKGFYSETKMYERYHRVAYIPGLIRAQLRKLKRTNAITGLFLLGPEEVLTPFYLTTSKYDSSEVIPAMPSAKIHTDVFYAIPSLPLVVQTGTHHDQIMPWVWSCHDGNGNVRLGNWCRDNEWRYWPTPALTAYRWAPHVPLARTFNPAEQLSSTFFQDLPMESILGVGRYPTQERFLGIKDYAVADYVEKVRRWHNELPSLKGTSVGSHGGSTGDTWIFTEEDNTTFQSVYGVDSKIYASEFFVPLPKCSMCEYQTGSVVLGRVATQNRTSIMMTAHGGPLAAQAPYANGNIPSTYTGENAYRYELSELRKIAYRFPTFPSVKIIKEGGNLVGHIFANSCSVSNYNLDNGLNEEFRKLDPTANQRSFAEQWLSLPNAGALNTFMNNDVGFGGGDNDYNVKFMHKIQEAWDNCGTIGDAYRMVISDMVKGDMGGAWDWQLYNRQMLGSPMNAIAAPARHCIKKSSNF